MESVSTSPPPLEFVFDLSTTEEETNLQLVNESTSLFGQLLLEMFQFYKGTSRCLPMYIMDNIFKLSQYRSTSLEVDDLDIDALAIDRPPALRFFSPTGRPIATLVYGLYQLGDEFYTLLFDFGANKFNILIHHAEGKPLNNRITMERIGPLFSEWMATTYRADTMQPSQGFPMIGVQSFSSEQPAFSALLVIMQRILNFSMAKQQDYWKMGATETMAALFEEHSRMLSPIPSLRMPVLARLTRLENYASSKSDTDLIRTFTTYHLPCEEVDRVRGKARVQADAVPLALYYLSSVGPDGKRKPVFHVDVVAFMYRFQLLKEETTRARDQSPKRRSSGFSSGKGSFPSDEILKKKISQMNTAVKDDEKLPFHLRRLEKSLCTPDGRKNERLFIRPTEIGIQYAEFLLGLRETPVGVLNEDDQKANSMLILELITKYGAMSRDELLHRLMNLHNENPELVPAFTWKKVNLNVILILKKGTLIQKGELLFLAKTPQLSWVLRTTLRNPVFQPPVTIEFNDLLSTAIDECFGITTGISANEIFAFLFPKPAFEQLKLTILQQVLHKKCIGKTATLLSYGLLFFRKPAGGAPFDVDELYRQCTQGWVEKSLQQKGFGLHPEAILIAHRTRLFPNSCRMLYALDQEHIFKVRDSQLPFTGAGFGLFAAVDLPAHLLIEITGESQLRDHDDQRFLTHGFAFEFRNQIWEIDCKPPGQSVTCMGAFANDGRHIIKPNMSQLLVDGLEGRLFLEVLENVPAGTELLWDYGEDYWRAFETEEKKKTEPLCYKSYDSFPDYMPSLDKRESDELSSYEGDYSSVDMGWLFAMPCHPVH
jgi:hypothetical protein